MTIIAGTARTVLDLTIRLARPSDVAVLRTACVLGLLLLGRALGAQPARGNPIDTLVLRAHARFLSHDSLGGRANGSRGQGIAADYIIAQLRRLGLEGLGPNGDFRQPVPLTR